MNTSSLENKVGDETVVDEERVLSQAGDAETESEDDVDVDEELLDLLTDLATEAKEKKAEKEEDVFQTSKS